jgi:8-oxo-dGTP diphosphatase
VIQHDDPRRSVEARPGAAARRGDHDGRGGDAPLTRVLAAVIRQGERLLLCKRPAHKRHGGLWEFPGGKLEAGEDLLAAARRELHEELALQATSVGDVVFRRQDPGSSFLIEFAQVEVRGEPVPLEHDELRWLTPAEARLLPLAPTDAAFVASLNDTRADEPADG